MNNRLPEATIGQPQLAKLISEITQPLPVLIFGMVIAKTRHEFKNNSKMEISR